MDLDFTPEQKQLYEEVVEFARKELNGDIEARDREERFSHEQWKKACEKGMAGLPVPQEYGGRGLDYISTMIAMEALGYGCEDSGLIFSLGAHMATASVVLWKLGTEAQQAKYLNRVASGQMPAIGAITEPNAGSDAFAALTTTAVRDGDHYVINGEKRNISCTTTSELFNVFTVTDKSKGFHGGITAFLIEKGTPGLEILPPVSKMGLRTMPLGGFKLNNVRVPAENILGGVGGGGQVFNVAMDWERVTLFASHVGTMQRVLEKTIRYARMRKQGGQTIGKHQAIAHKIVDMKMLLEASRLLVYKAASNLQKSMGASMESSMVKAYVSEAYVEVARQCIQVHGAIGYWTSTGVERVLRDAIASTIYSGTSEIHRNIVARWLGL